MAGFIRRYPFYPGNETITQIEGVIIIDQAPPGRIEGGDTGAVCVVGEFVNMSQAVKVSAGGEALEDLRAVEVLGGQDLLDKVGGFDELLGEFGGSMGNGFVEIRNKRFQRLILMPVNLLTPTPATAQGTLRLWRQLPTNQSATVAQPIIPVSGAVVPAGREFRDGTDRLRLASHAVFTDQIAYKSATDGAVTADGAGVTQDFASASGDFVNAGVQKGDILVLGVLGEAGALGANADTYRVTAVTNDTTLVVQKMDGSSWTWTSGTAQPYRLHPQATADTSPTPRALAEAAGYSVLARPLDDTITTATEVTPTVVPSAPTADSWNPLSGLTGKVHPSTAITYTAAVHAPNVAASATLDARYQAAFDALLSDDYPERDINIVLSARKSGTLRSKAQAHVGIASERGLTRRTIVSPPVNEHTIATVVGDASPGAGATRSERVDYSWPGVQSSIPEAVGFSIATSDGGATTDGMIDVTGDGWLASVQSLLPPERNPAQAAAPVPTIMAPVQAFARGTPKLDMSAYILLRQYGVCAVRFDKTAGPIFQSGVTSSLVSGEKNIMRRRMADFLQDAISARLVNLSKLPMTQAWKDDQITEIVGFLEPMKNPDNPLAQRINDYSVDDRSGNTPNTEAAGIHVILTSVRLTPTGDFIVLQTNIGEGVVITQAVPAA